MPTISMQFSKEMFYRAFDENVQSRKMRSSDGSCDVREEVGNAYSVSIFHRPQGNTVVVNMTCFRYCTSWKMWIRTSCAHLLYIENVGREYDHVIQSCKSFLNEDYNRVWKNRISVLNRFLDMSPNIPDELQRLVKSYVLSPEPFEELLKRAQ